MGKNLVYIMHKLTEYCYNYSGIAKWNMKTLSYCHNAFLNFRQEAGLEISDDLF